MNHSCENTSLQNVLVENLQIFMITSYRCSILKRHANFMASAISHVIYMYFVTIAYSYTLWIRILGAHLN